MPFHRCSLPFIAVFMVLVATTYATPPNATEIHPSSRVFIENRGQLLDQFHHPRGDIQFSVKAAPGLTIFVGCGAIHYQFNHAQHAVPAAPLVQKAHFAFPDPLEYDMDRLDVQLIGANSNATVVKEEMQQYCEHYYTGLTMANEGLVASYTRITYQNIYPHIDWVLYFKDGLLEHEFVVHPGARVSDIRLHYGGASSLTINADGSLVAATPQGAIAEHAPMSMQADGREVASHFVLNNNVLSYDIAAYTGDLIIDPSLVWATYFGGIGDEFQFGVYLDAAGDIITTGWTASLAAIATSGAYHTTYAGGPYDAYVTKFSADGSLLWATYFGGDSYESGLAVTIDLLGNIFMSGCTKSTTSVATPGAYQTTHGGYYDAFLSKFTSSGALLWATYFGGTGWDQAMGLVTDDAGNVYMAGESQSNSGISTAGAWQTVFGGYWDAFLAKFSGAGAIQWSTYLGGAGEDVGYGLCKDLAGHLYMSGYTSSVSGIATSGAWQTGYGGGAYDAFLSQFDTSGTLLWSSYYGGTDEDQGFAAATDSLGFVYLTGSSASASAIATAGAHQTPLEVAAVMLLLLNSIAMATGYGELIMAATAWIWPMVLQFETPEPSTSPAQRPVPMQLLPPAHSIPPMQEISTHSLRGFPVMVCANGRVITEALVLMWAAALP